MYHKWESMPNLDHLKCLNTAELLDLLEDDRRIRDTVRVNSKLRALQKSKVVLVASNCWLADQNFAYQPYLNKTKLLLAKQYQDLGQLVSSIRRKQRKIETLQQRFNFQAIHMFLKKKIDHSMGESKNIWQAFIEGKMLLTDFVKSLQNSQKLYHKRLVQAEKIHALIIQTHIYETEDTFPYVGHHSTLLHTPTTINVFGGVSPVILLPGFQYPDLQASYLPPLKVHGCIDSCFKSNKDSDHKQGLCKCTESHRWPQRHFSLQPLEKIHQPKLPK